jgi:hypothetical protein
MSHGKKEFGLLISGRSDGEHFDLGHVLPVTVPFLEAFAAVFPEHDDFLVPDVFEHLDLDGAGRLQGGLRLIDVHEGLNFYNIACCGILPGDEKLVALLYQILFVGNLDQRLHHSQNFSDKEPEYNR